MKKLLAFFICLTGGFHYGAGLGMLPTKGIGHELTYLRPALKAPHVYYDNGTQNTTFELIQNILFLGASRYFGKGGTGAGVSGYSTYYQFSLGGGLVFNIRTRQKATIILLINKYFIPIVKGKILSIT